MKHHPRLGMALVLGLCMLLGPVAATEVPTLGEDRLLFDSDRTGNYELWAMGTDGSDPVQLTDDPAYDSWWPKLSPDRTRIVFTRSPAGVHDRDYSATSLWSVAVDGTDLRELIPNRGYGWDVQGHPEWSPDGTRLAMFAGAKNNPQIVVTRADGTAPRAVTSRGGTNVDPSWHPSGQRLLFVGCPQAACLPNMYEIYEVGLLGGMKRLTADTARDHDPYYAPDGSAIAWLRQVPQGWAIYKMAPDGSDQQALVDRWGISSKPAWSLDSQTIYFHGTPLGQTRFNVFAVPAEGGSVRALESRPPLGFGAYDNEYPVHSSF